MEQFLINKEDIIDELGEIRVQHRHAMDKSVFLYKRLQSEKSLFENQKVKTLKKSLDYLFDLHLEHIGGMLARIIEAGLKLVAHKCMWAYDASKPMDWLGFTMENNLLKPQESKVKAIKEYPVPTTAKQLDSVKLVDN